VIAHQLLLGVVTVGTDHHHFDRLMTWLESWTRQNPGKVRWVVQHGSSRRMQDAENFDMKPHAELLTLLASAQVIVTQGGPGGIMDSRTVGVKPIAVPRLAEFGEVVDDHQVSFCKHLAANDLIVHASTETELHAALDEAVRCPASLSIQDQTSNVASAVQRFGEVVGELVHTRPPRRRA
jgi:UDP-N-acetylglucosamine transferase subunit ALG13